VTVEFRVRVNARICAVNKKRFQASVRVGEKARDRVGNRVGFELELGLGSGLI